MILKHHYLLIGSLLAITAAAMLFSLVSGSAQISAYQIMSHFASPEKEITSQILDQIRVPRTLAAFSVGSLLAISGEWKAHLWKNARDLNREESI